MQRLQRRRVPEGGQRLCTGRADRIPVEPDVQRAQHRRGVQLRKRLGPTGADLWSGQWGRGWDWACAGAG